MSNCGGSTSDVATGSGGNGAFSQGGTSNSSSGGPQSTGGNGAATGGAVSCPSGAFSCGGDLVGTWTVVSSCLTVSGTMDMVPLGSDCTLATVTGGSLQVAAGGTLKFDATTYTDNTTTTGSEQVDLPLICLHLSGAITTCQRIGQVAPTIFNFESSSICVDASSGCSCQFVANQTSWAGTITPSATDNDVYTTQGIVLTLHSGPASTTYRYCVYGNTLTMTPTPASPTIAGEIVFQKS